MKLLRKKRKAPPELAKPQMTALVDVLTVLVFFLLKNFSTEGDIVTQSKNLELPYSSAKIKPEIALNVSISRQHILADGNPVALVSEERERPGPMIPGLAGFLEQKRRQTDAIAEFDGNVAFNGRLTIQGDKEIPYWLLQKVLSTCGENGYSSFSLAVNKKDAD